MIERRCPQGRIEPQFTRKADDVADALGKLANRRIASAAEVDRAAGVPGKDERRRRRQVVDVDELAALIPAGSTVYHTGEGYGHVYWAPELGLHEWRYDEPSGTFGDGARVPQWIVLQRSPLIHYSRIPATVERLVRDRYELVRAFPVTADGTDRLYDQQDAFFLPLDGLAGIERPGPSFEIYRLREGSRAAGT